MLHYRLFYQKTGRVAIIVKRITESPFRSSSFYARMPQYGSKWAYAWLTGRIEVEAATILDGLKTQVLGRHVLVYPVIGSTNDEAKRLAAEGAPEGTLVLAEEQTAGRGRQGRRWHAPPGTALLMSLVLRPPLSPDRAGQLTLALALAAAEAVEAETGLKVGFKWPNDLLVRGQKLGGILAELSVLGAALEWAVVGLGLNVNLDFAAAGLDELVGQATSLSLELGRPVDRVRLLQTLLSRAEAYLATVYRGTSLHQQWNARLEQLGQPVVVQTRVGQVAGIAEGINASGAFLLRQNDGTAIEIVVE